MLRSIGPATANLRVSQSTINKLISDSTEALRSE
jgi:hypothetical protein